MTSLQVRMEWLLLLLLLGSFFSVSSTKMGKSELVGKDVNYGFNISLQFQLTILDMAELWSQSLTQGVSSVMRVEKVNCQIEQLSRLTKEM